MGIFPDQLIETHRKKINQTTLVGILWLPSQYLLGFLPHPDSTWTLGNPLFPAGVVICFGGVDPLLALKVSFNSINPS